jgi:diacylglycerol kinase family enzyme
VSAPSGFLVVANGNAGSAERAEVDTALGILAEAAPVRLRPTASPDDVDAVLDGVDDRTVVVAGGDGSLHLVVARLRARGQAAAPVGLVPLGTGNDFARGAGVPLDPADAARRIVDGRPRPIDVLVDDDGGIVVNAVHAGVGAAAADRAEGMKDRLGPLAYPVGAVLAAVRADGWRLDVTVDGTPLPLPGDRVLMVGVGNGPSIGGGTPLCPGAEPDDGALDVVVACATGPAARAAFGRALRSGRHVERDDVVAVRGRQVRITGDAVGYDADGELDENVTDRTYRVEPAAWSLVS